MFHLMLTLLARHWHDIVALKIHAKLKLGNLNLAPRGFKNSLTDNFAADPGGQGDGCGEYLFREKNQYVIQNYAGQIQVKLVDLL